MVEHTKWVWFTVGLFIGLIAGVGGLTLTKRVQPAAIVIQPPAPTPTPAATATAGPLQVYINGQVAAPAVYELPAGSIVADLVEAAGGFMGEANTAVVNLAQPLQDGMQVYVPDKDEVVAAPVVVAPDGPEATGGESTTVDGGGGKVNINTATVEELETLPGIGPSTAQKIVEHRDSSGLFTAIEGIMDVSGVGEAKFATIQELITVEGE